MNRSYVVGTMLLAASVAGCLDLDTSTGSTGSSTTTSSGSASGGSGGTIQEWQATEPTDEAGYTLPTWLRIECGTDDRTSQWTANAMRRPFNAHAARPRNIGNGWGLNVESRRKNLVENSDTWDGGTWNAPAAPITAMTKEFGNADPAGGNAATRFVVEPVRRSDQATVPVGYTTAWFRGGTDVPFVHFALSTGDTGWNYETLSGMADWTRVSLGTGSGTLFLDTAGDLISGVPALNITTTLMAYGVQHENDANGSPVKYPSSYIPTTTKSRLRDADTLSSTSAQELIPDGYFHAIVTFAPHYASNEGSSLYHHILFINSTNAVRIELDKGKITLVGTGNTLSGPTSGTLVWSREQELKVEIMMTPSHRELSVSGATEGDFTISDDADTPWPSNGTVYILGDTSGAQEGSDLRYIGFFSPNQ